MKITQDTTKTFASIPFPFPFPFPFPSPGELLKAKIHSAAEELLGIAAAGARKGAFPSDAVGQTAAVFAALASAKDRITIDDIASGYRKSKNLERNIGGVLDSLVRLGHVTTRDGKVFQIRRL